MSFCELQENGRVCIHHDGSSLTISAPWLWSNCPSKVQSSSGQRLASPSHYAGQQIRQVKLVDKSPLIEPPNGSYHPVGDIYCNSDKAAKSNILQIEWDDDSTSYFSVDWLIQVRTMSKSVPTISSIKKDTQLYSIDFDLLLKSEEKLYDTYQAIFHNGVILVQNCPPEADSVARVGRLLGGRLSHGTLYGDLFDVKLVTDPEEQKDTKKKNIAYTSERLPPHQDLPYYSTPPGLQLLLCARPSHVGGETRLVDAIAAANKLRQLAPDLFKTLATIPATFVKQRPGVDLVYRRTHFEVARSYANKDDDDGLSTGEITSVHWAPPFEGPLILDNTDDDDESVAKMEEEYYIAYSAFARLVDSAYGTEPPHHGLSSHLVEQIHSYAEEHTWFQRLKEGELVVFNNLRMLHGREIFQGNNRLLHGTYVDLDDTLLRFRLLRRKLGRENDAYPIPGHGTMKCK